MHMHRIQQGVIAVKLPDRADYRQQSETQYGAYTCAVWTPHPVNVAEKQRLAACLLEIFSEENIGNPAENGRNVQKL